MAEENGLILFTAKDLSVLLCQIKVAVGSFISLWGEFSCWRFSESFRLLAALFHQLFIVCYHLFFWRFLKWWWKLAKPFTYFHTAYSYFSGYFRSVCSRPLSEIYAVYFEMQQSVDYFRFIRLCFKESGFAQYLPAMSEVIFINFFYFPC